MTLKWILMISLVMADGVFSPRAEAKAKVKAGKAKSAATAPAPAESGFYGFTVKDAEGHDVKLSDYRGKLVLVVNVASKCGYTPQYEGLEKLYQDYRARGFVILGFPSNQFRGQEPGTDAEIQQFCKLTYGVNFPVLAKIDVKGENANPLYRWLTSREQFKGDITWNFNKFLIGRDGRVTGRYPSATKPEELNDVIKKAL